MSVSISRNFGPLTGVSLVTQADWAKVGRLARERIVTRTISGKNVEGAPFAAYSEGYAKQKAKLGASATPNLTLSGEMLRSIVVEPDDKGVTLKFSR